MLGESYEAARAKGYHGLEPLHTTLSDYSVYRQHRDEPLTGAMWRSLVASGIPVDTVKTEMGHGQHEITFEPADGPGGRRPCGAGEAVHAGDRRAARPRGDLHGAPLHPSMGNSGHVHVSLADAAGVNLFDPDGHELAALGRSFAGGLMRRAPELMAWPACST